MKSWLHALVCLVTATSVLGAVPAAPSEPGRVTVWVYRSTPCLPAEGVTVRLEADHADGIRPDSIRPETRTGADGVARFEAVPPGPRQVTAEASGRRVAVLVHVASGADVHVALDLAR